MSNLNHSGCTTNCPVVDKCVCTICENVLLCNSLCSQTDNPKNYDPFSKEKCTSEFPYKRVYFKDWITKMAGENDKHKNKRHL